MYYLFVIESKGRKMFTLSRRFHLSDDTIPIYIYRQLSSSSKGLLFAVSLSLVAVSSFLLLVVLVDGAAATPINTWLLICCNIIIMRVR